MDNIFSENNKEKMMHLCGSSFEFCDGNCNSCTKKNFYSSDHTDITNISLATNNSTTILSMR